MKLGHLSCTEEVPPNNTIRSQFGQCIQIRKMRNAEETEAQENVKIYFWALPQASSQISQTNFFFLYPFFTSRTKNLLFKIFRLTAVGLLSSRSNFVSEVKGRRDLQQSIFELDWLAPKKKYLEEKIPSAAQTTTDDNNNKPLHDTIFVPLSFVSVFFVYLPGRLFSPKLFLPSANKQTSVLSFYCSTPPSVYPSFVLTFYCSTFLLLYPSIVSPFHWFTLLLFYPSIVLNSSRFIHPYLSTVMFLYCSNLLLFYSSSVQQP